MYTEGRGSNPPDYLLLDLLCSPYRTTAMNSSSGKININTTMYPPYISNIIRSAPLQALFANLQVNGTPVPANIAQDIQQKEQQMGGFHYTGELAEESDMQVGNNQWTKEALLRSVAGLITTRSNSFGLWGAAETVKETPSGTIIPVADKRFHAIIERYVWPGVDGALGNAYYDESKAVGAGYTRIGKFQNGSLAPGDNVNDVVDGPDAIPQPTAAILTPLIGTVNLNNFFPSGPGLITSVSFGTTGRVVAMVYDNNNTTLEQAYNPLAPYMKYRIVDFKYLNE